MNIDELKIYLKRKIKSQTDKSNDDKWYETLRIIFLTEAKIYQKILNKIND